jgi:methylated-DNA-[protein]-cysteine S-methyltransferase
VLHATWDETGLRRVVCEDAVDAADGTQPAEPLGAEGGHPLPQRLPPPWPAGLPHGAGDLAGRLGAALARYLEGSPEPFDLPRAPEGTPFQREVWAALRELPYGTTVSYTEIARRVGSHPRAVGQAVGQNPLWIVVPCHRVLGRDGRLTGYAGGLARKAALLRIEGALR